jgi:hypothetical protein
LDALGEKKLGTDAKHKHFALRSRSRFVSLLRIDWEDSKTVSVLAAKSGSGFVVVEKKIA